MKPYDDSDDTRQDEWNKRNVTGISKQPTSDGKVNIYVTKKYTEPVFKRLINDDRTKITEQDRISKTVTVNGEQYETDVVEIGEVKAHSSNANKVKLSPKYKNWYGTGAAVVTREYATIRGKQYNMYNWPSWMKKTIRNSRWYEQEHYLLTNRHVTRKDYLSDAYEQFYTYRNTTLEYVEASQNKKTTDSALTQAITSPIPYKPGNIPGIGRVPPACMKPEKGMKVEKIGARTGYTTGKVQDPHADIRVDMNGRPVVVPDCIVTTSMSEPGDSGSLTLQFGMGPVGLLFAGSTQATIHIPIQRVMDEHKVTFT